LQLNGKGVAFGKPLGMGDRRSHLIGQIGDQPQFHPSPGATVNVVNQNKSVDLVLVSGGHRQHRSLLPADDIPLLNSHLGHTLRAHGVENGSGILRRPF
jgi:hypothetical protein